MTWSFRNRIDVRPTSRLQCSEPEWIIDDSEPGKLVKLVAKFPRTVLPVPGGVDLAEPERVGPIAEATRLILTGSGYESEAAALAAGELWRARLMRAFAALNVGADFGGENTPSGYITPAGFAEIAPGRRAMNDPPKLWAYEIGEEEPIFLSPNRITLQVSSPHAALEAAMADAVATGGLTQENQVAYSLFSGSFGLAPEARFALLMAAVEAMMDAEGRPAEALALIEQWKRQVRTSPLRPDDATSLINAMAFLRTDSISVTGQKLASKLEPKQYGGATPAQFFKRCYSLRSRLMHGQHPIPTPAELGPAAASLERFVADLLTVSDSASCDNESVGARKIAVPGNQRLRAMVEAAWSAARTAARLGARIRRITRRSARGSEINAPVAVAR